MPNVLLHPHKERQEGSIKNATPWRWQLLVREGGERWMLKGEQITSAERQREQQADCIVADRHTRTHEHTQRLTQRAHVCTCVCVSVIAMQIERFILRDLRIHNESQYWHWKQCKQSQHSQSQSQSRTEHSRLFRWFCKLNCNEVMPWPGFHWWWGC